MQSRAEQGAASAAIDRPGAAQATGVKPADLEYLPYGPTDQPEDGCEIVATFGEVEAEYAAIRRGAALLDWPQRGTLLVTGADRRGFLNNMLTNDIAHLESGMATRAFQTNRKGRIEADLTLIELGDRLLIDLDIHQAAATVASLSEFIFTEDVVVQNISSDTHRIAVHGPRAMEAIGRACGDESFRLDEQCACTTLLGGHDVVAVRSDCTGEIGIDLLVGYDNARSVWEQLLGLDAAIGQPGERIRPTGWYAWNIARIEGGTPLFNIDFGPTNLPHETGVLRDRVNFKKGCYPGQEIVARLENLGKPKQQLRGLRVEGDLLPIAGAQVFAMAADESMGDQVGVVTSSTLSPMLGATPIAFAMIKGDAAELGTTLLVNAEGQQAQTSVSELRFLPTPVASPTA